MLELATKSNINNWIQVMPTSKCIDGIKKIERADQNYPIVPDAAKQREQMDLNRLMKAMSVS
jgi:hypothetical protein